MENPKSEGRRPKEGRNPKSEEVGSGITSVDAEFWAWGEEPNDAALELREGPPQGNGPPQDIMERTALFGESIIRFAKKIPQNPVNDRLISQVVGAGTSIGADYCEADDSISGKEFKQRIGTSRKESKETMLFLRLIATAEPSLAAEARLLWREAKELNLIFGAIWRK